MEACNCVDLRDLDKARSCGVHPRNSRIFALFKALRWLGWSPNHDTFIWVGAGYYDGSRDMTTEITSLSFRLELVSAAGLPRIFLFHDFRECNQIPKIQREKGPSVNPHLSHAMRPLCPFFAQKRVCKNNPSMCFASKGPPSCCCKCTAVSSTISRSAFFEIVAGEGILTGPFPTCAYAKVSPTQ